MVMVVGCTSWVKIHPTSSLKVWVNSHPECTACKNLTLWQFFKLHCIYLIIGWGLEYSHCCFECNLDNLDLSLTFAVRPNTTFFSYIVGKNSSILLKRKTYMCTQWVKIHPWLLQWNFHSMHCGWKFFHDFFFETMGEFSPTAYSLLCAKIWLYDNFSKVLFDQHTWFVINMWRKEIDKVMTFLFM